MRANKIYQITKTKELTDFFKGFRIKKVQIFKEYGETKIYFYDDKKNFLTVTSPRDIGGDRIQKGK